MAAGISTGSVIAQYRLEAQIGSGGMAVVFRARDQRLGRPVAVKILAPALASEQAFRQRFIREQRVAAAVDDPHIIPVFEAGEFDGHLFIAMRYVPGGDLGSRIRRSGPLTPEHAAAIVSPVAAALDAAHEAGLIHRDVKPENMLLDARPGRPDHVYLSDFGLGRHAISSAGITASGLALGTPGYAAPEQVQGMPVDGRTDQYALACATFAMLTGEPPFQRDNVMAMMWAGVHDPPPPLTQLRHELPPAADRVVARALAKDAAERYSSCQEFADDLRAALGLPRYDSYRRSIQANPRVPTEISTEPASRADSEKPIVPEHHGQANPADCTRSVSPNIQAPGIGLKVSVRMDPREVDRQNQQPEEIIAAPHHHVCRGDIVASRSFPANSRWVSGIYILYQDNTAALLAPGGEMPDLSPAGDWISYVIGRREIWLMRPDGSDSRPVGTVVDSSFTISAAPRWSPDSRTLAFALTDFVEGAKIYVLDVTSGSFELFSQRLSSDLLVDGPAEWLEFHGPTAWLAGRRMFVSCAGQLCLLDGNSGEAQWPLGPFGHGEVRDPARSPDGSMLIFAQCLREPPVSFLSFINLRGSLGRSPVTARYGIRLDGLNISTPRMSGDNQTVIFSSDDVIYSVRLRKRLGRPVETFASREDIQPLLHHAKEPVPVVREWPSPT
jgi:serine/threonine-protein kinase